MTLPRIWLCQRWRTPRKHPPWLISLCWKRPACIPTDITITRRFMVGPLFQLESSIQGQMKEVTQIIDSLHVSNRHISKTIWLLQLTINLITLAAPLKEIWARHMVKWWAQLQVKFLTIRLLGNLAIQMYITLVLLCKLKINHLEEGWSGMNRWECRRPVEQVCIMEIKSLRCKMYAICLTMLIKLSILWRALITGCKSLMSSLSLPDSWRLNVKLCSQTQHQSCRAMFSKVEPISTLLNNENKCIISLFYH